MNDAGAASIEKIQSALGVLSPHDRDDWIRVGMAIKAELGDDGHWIWDDWSQGADNYHPKSAASVWKSIRIGGKVQLGTLFYMAKSRGWAWDKPERKLSAAEVAQAREASRQKALAAAAARAAEHAEAAARAAAIWGAAAPSAEHPYLTRKGVRSHGLRVGTWETVDPDTGEIRVVSKLALLVPIKDRTGTLHSLQAIFSRKLYHGRDKDYLAGGAKAGHFHAIGKPVEHDGKRVFILAEGYATAASIHESTGHCALVCFDASNLLPVASAIRERQPDATILLAADNDQFTKRKDGTPYNPGIEAATKAALEVGGHLAVPQFDSLNGEPTDFNDLHHRQGEEAVRAAITAALDAGPVQAPAEEPAPAASPEPTFEQLAQAIAEPNPAPDAPDAESAKPKPALDEDEHLAKNKHFTILGYDHGDYYFFVHAKQQVMRRTRADFNDSGFLELANDINWWEANWPGYKGGIDHKAAMSWILHVAHSRGVYDPRRVRGRGAWLDAGRAVFHHGAYLTVDGVPTKIPEMESSYVYPMGASFAEPADTALTVDEGRWLLSVAEMIRWRSPGSSALMTGWTMLAPICGALKWRPHIWITGAAGSGKSTIQRDFCAALLRGIAEYYNGDSSEAGIRQDLKSDAIPVLIDELESNTEHERRRVEGIIGMVRKSSSETQARTAKGTTSGEGLHFMVRSMFCLASINVNLPGKADIDRLTRLVIRPPATDEVDRWDELEEALYRIVSDDTISQRLLARALDMIPTVHASIAVFCRAAAAKFGSQRHGDQYGTLLAGCWCLTHDEAPTAAQAEEMLNRYDWNEHTEDHGEDDSTGALNALMNAKIRMPGQVGEVSVFELIQEAHPVERQGRIDQSEAEFALRRHGIRLEITSKGEWLLIGTGVPNLREIMRHSSYATDIRGQLLRLPKASRWEGRTLKFASVASKCIAIPLAPLFEDDDQSAPSVVATQTPDDYPL